MTLINWSVISASRNFSFLPRIPKWEKLRDNDKDPQEFSIPN